MYLVLGNMLADDHDRAIRFSDQSRAIKLGAKLFGANTVTATWCNACACWHVCKSLNLKPNLTCVN